MQILFFVHFFHLKKIYNTDHQQTNKIKLITFQNFAKKSVRKYGCFRYLAVSILLQN
jgi:hypothetical protein